MLQCIMLAVCGCRKLKRFVTTAQRVGSKKGLEETYDLSVLCSNRVFSVLMPARQSARQLSAALGDGDRSV